MIKKSVRRKLGFLQYVKKSLANFKLTKLKVPSCKFIIRTVIAVALTISTSYCFNNLSVNGHTLVDDILIKHIETVKILPCLEIGRITKLDKPENLPIFKSEDEAINYVKAIPYDLWEDDPINVLTYKKGNCLGKCRLLYFIGKNQGYKFQFYKTETHIKLKKGDVYVELT